MASQEAKVVKDERLTRLLKGVANNVLLKVYGPAGMPWGTRFAELEEVAVQVGQKLSRAMVNQALNQQATEQSSGAAAWRRCSGCGGPAEIEPDPEPSIMTTRVGDAEWSEPKCYCHKCRRSFFPSA